MCVRARSLDETLVQLCGLHAVQVFTLESDVARRVLENAVAAGNAQFSGSSPPESSCTTLVWILYQRARAEIASQPAGPGIHSRREPQRRIASLFRSSIFVTPPSVAVQRRLEGMLRDPKFCRADDEPWVQSDPVLITAMNKFGAAMDAEDGAAWATARTAPEAWYELRRRLFVAMPITRHRHRARRVDKQIRDGVRVHLPSTLLRRPPSDTTRMYHARLGPGKTRDRLMLEFETFVAAVTAGDSAARCVLVACVPLCL